MLSYCVEIYGPQSNGRIEVLAFGVDISSQRLVHPFQVLLSAQPSGRVGVKVEILDGIREVGILYKDMWLAMSLESSKIVSVLSWTYLALWTTQLHLQVLPESRRLNQVGKCSPGDTFSIRRYEKHKGALPISAEPIWLSCCRAPFVDS